MQRLSSKYPLSEACNCRICVGFCMRPGWWTVDEAEKAIVLGYSKRMMVEVSPELNYCVLAPAFKGNEGDYALQIFSKNGCTFFIEGKCELFGKGIQPLECRFCHHSQMGLGYQCHEDIGKEWNSLKGKKIIVEWGDATGFWQKQGFILKVK